MQGATINLNKSTNCYGVIDLCAGTTTCTPNINVNIYQKSGNTYGNIIKDPYTDISKTSNYSLFNSKLYTSSLSFEPKFLSDLNEAIKKGENSNGEPIYIIKTYPKSVQSKSNILWTSISNPAFAYMRPWWLSTFSISLLTTDTFNIEGIMAPGFCPYHLSNSIEDYFTVQEKIKTLFVNSKHPLTLVSFLRETHNKLSNLNSSYDSSSSGIILNSKNRVISEDWQSIEKVFDFFSFLLIFF